MSSDFSHCALKWKRRFMTDRTAQRPCRTSSEDRMVYQKAHGSSES
jgi:hypothetical protein